MPASAAIAIGYVRVSTAGQAEDGISLEAQAAKIRAYCELNGLQLLRIESDDGISGKRADNRPALQRTLDAIRSGEAGAIVVYSLSRLTRSVADLDRFARAFDLHSVSEKIDTSSAAGRMLVNLLGVVGQWEREATAERTAAALAHKRSKGEKTGGAVPYGFERGADGVSLEPEASEQEIIEDIRRQKASGASLCAIARSLNERGITAKAGGIWFPQTVKNAIRNADRFGAAMAA